MPPVLHITFDELSAGGAQQMLAYQFALGDRESHNILELVPEAIGAAGLIESRPGPNTAGQSLVQQPSVQEQIHRGLRRRDLYGVEQVVPKTGRLAENVI